MNGIVSNLYNLIFNIRIKAYRKAYKEIKYNL